MESRSKATRFNISCTNFKVFSISEYFQLSFLQKKTEVNLPLFLQYLQDCELENLEVQQKPALLIVRCVQRRQLVLTYRRKIYMEITNITLDNERVEDHLAWKSKQHFATPPIRHPGLSWMLRDPWGTLKTMTWWLRWRWCW